MRLFFALPLPPDALAAAAAAQRRLREACGPGAKLSFPAAAQLHVTLAFLGELPDADSAAEAGRAAWTFAEAFDVSLEGLGAFPNARRPRALFLAVAEGAAAVSARASELRDALAARGLPVEARPFRPHLTLARVKPGGERDAARALAALPAGAAIRFRARALRLLRSEPGPRGAAHHLVEELLLRG